MRKGNFSSIAGALFLITLMSGFGCGLIGGTDGGTQDAGLDGGTSEEMVFIPDGGFWMGCNNSVDTECWQTWEVPYHQVQVPAFNIDKYEVRMGDYKKCVAAGRCTNHWDDKLCYIDNGSSNWTYDVLPANNRGDSQPAVCIDWNQAKQYCEWVGKRLPTEAEWEKAARSTDGRKYPWGNTPAINCDYAVWSETGTVNEGCGAKTAMPVGSKPKGISPYGVLDMVGNVNEWVEDDWHDTYTGAPTNGSAWVDSPRATTRSVRSGSWGNPYKGGLRSSSRGYSSVVPMYTRNDFGFRCASGITTKCIPGEKLCLTNTTYHVCNNGGEWDPAKSCGNEQICYEGECKTMVCVPNQRKCLDEVTAEKCKSDGSAWDIEDCTKETYKKVCIDGYCSAPICVPGALRCDYGVRQVCSAKGNKWVDAPCETGFTCVNNGECKAIVCTPNERICQDDVTVKKCKSDGTGWDIQDCSKEAYNKVCIDGYCAAPICTPGIYRCQNGVRQICSDKGNKWVDAPCEMGKICYNGNCVGNICTPNEKRCDTDAMKIEKCKADGSAWEVYDDCYSKSKYCVKSYNEYYCYNWICEPNKVECYSGNTKVRKCKANGSAWEDIKTCNTGEICENGECKTKICEPNEYKCKDKQTSKKCSPQGTSWIDISCVPSGICDDFCRNDGKCIPAGVMKYNDTDKKLYAFCSTTMNYLDALDVCESWNGSLISIDTLEKGEYFINFFTQVLKANSWIGFSDRVVSGSWLWEDGSAGNYTHWYPGEPNNQGSEHCTELMSSWGQIDSNARWNNSVCSDNWGFICQRPCTADYCGARICTPGTSRCKDDYTSQNCSDDGTVWIDAPCGSGLICDTFGSQNGKCTAANTYDGKLYAKSTQIETWDRARKKCQDWGGDLVTIKDIDKEAFILGLTAGDGNITWIGLSDTAIPGTPTWVDDTFMIFDFMYPYPRDNQGKHCVYQQPNNRWAYSWCTDSNYYICEKPCPGGDCKGRICTPGQRRCKDDFSSEECKADGTGWELKPCDEGYICDNFCSLNGKCANGGVFDGNIYSMCKLSSTWDRGRKRCQEWGGDLTSITLPDEEGLVKGLSGAYTVWIGLNNIDDYNNPVWSDGNNYTFNYFGRNGDWDNSRRCVNSWINGRWFFSECSRYSGTTDFGYICKKACPGGNCAGQICIPGQKRCKDDFTSQICNVTGNAWIDIPCDKGSICDNFCQMDASCVPTVVMGGRMYGKCLTDQNESSTDWSGAKNRCNTWGGSLATVSNQSVQSILKQSLGGKTAWMGMYWDFDQAKYLWDSGEAGLDYLRSGGTDYNNPYCGWFSTDGTWGLISCSRYEAYGYLSYVCEKDCPSGNCNGQICTPGLRRCKNMNSAEICAPSGNSWIEQPCDSGKVCDNYCVADAQCVTSLTIGGKKYFKCDITGVVQDIARGMCQNWLGNGAKMASVLSEDENTQLKNYFNRTDDRWWRFGLAYDTASSTWKWDNGDTLSWTKKTPPTDPGNNKCTMFRYNGDWEYYPCDSIFWNTSYVCEIKP